MAFDVKNTASGGSIASVSSITAAAQNVIAGNLLVVAVSILNATSNPISSIQDTAGNNANFVLIPGATLFTGGTTNGLAFYYVKNCLGNAANIVTVNFSSPQIFSTVFVWQIEGADTSAPLDALATGVGHNAGTPTTVATSAFSTTNANTIICGFAVDRTGIASFTSSLDTLDSAGIAPAGCAAAAHSTVSSIQTNITPSFTDAPSTTYIGVAAVAFKQATALAVQSVVVNGGNPVQAGTTFSVVVTLDGNVSQNTGVSIAKLAGEAITGTTTGTITTGNNSVTLTGLALFVAAAAQVIEATQTSGDPFTSGDSAAFNVVAGSVSRADTTALGQPQVSVGFSVQVDSTDGFDNPQVVSQDTVVHLTLGAGTGVLSGTLSGTILSGTSTVTIAGVLYNKNEAGVTVVATSTSGDSIGPLGVHNAFNVGPAFAPTFSPSSGDFAVAQTVTITSATAGGTIYYTTDGTTPTHLSSSIVNGGTVSVTQSTWLKAIEVAAGFIDSPVGDATYVIAPMRANSVFESGPQFATRTESPATSVDGTNLGTRVIG